MIESPMLNQLIEEEVAKRLPKKIAELDEKLKKLAEKRVEALAAKSAIIRAEILAEILAEKHAEVLAERLAAKHLAASASDRLQEIILDVLDTRFGPVPLDLWATLQAIVDEDRLQQLAVSAGTSPSRESFCGDLRRQNQPDSWKQTISPRTGALHPCPRQTTK
jgi:hypothetical protein